MFRYPYGKSTANQNQRDKDWIFSSFAEAGNQYQPHQKARLNSI